MIMIENDPESVTSSGLDLSCIYITQNWYEQKLKSNMMIYCQKL